jgi:cytidylate kinase
VSLDDVREDLGRRDHRDRSREDSPLKAAPDAVTVDSSGLDLEGQIAAVLEVVRRHPRCPASGAAG